MPLADYFTLASAIGICRHERTTFVAYLELVLTTDLIS